MNVTYRVDKDILYIAIEGRVDASNAVEAEDKIFKIKNENNGCYTVIDADKLEYVSSAGLRIILKLRKEEPALAIINVSAEVYEIFDMTGFTDMVTVERAYPQISIEGCEFIAKGANGAVYRYDDETIVKVYFSKDSLPDIKQERENARKAFVLGVNTAIPYGIVRVGDGYGMVTELLNSSSATKLIRNDPNNLDLPVKYFVDMLKSIHSTEVEPGEFPDAKKSILKRLETIAPHLSEGDMSKLRRLVDEIPSRNTLLHGDYHTNNIMIQNGEPVLIDLDTLSVGHPIFELGQMFNAFVGFGEIDHENIMEFFGFTFETANRFINKAIKLYIGTEEDSVCEAVIEKARIIGYIRLLSRSIRRVGDPKSPARIEYCKKMLGILINKVESLDF